jgi:RNA polymerase sigma factor for flagellar operon FliA
MTAVTRQDPPSESRQRPVGELDELVASHRDLVVRIAYHLVSRLPATVEVGDLIQAGMIGLLQAAASFRSDRNASFSTYAGIRIRGAILDELRRGNWTPRSVNRATRQIAEAARRVETTTGMAATPAEVAASMGITVERYFKLADDAVACRLVSFESGSLDDEDRATGFSEPYEPGPETQLEQASRQEAVVAAIEGLPERMRLVLALYYDEELTLREIGEVLGVTESRVCQLHREALKRLQVALEE